MGQVDYEFWEYVDRLVRGSKIIIDRERGAESTRRPGAFYPVDYGYLAGTLTSDGAGVDVWVGSDDSTRITGVICTVDLVKKDTELKILLGCTDAEMRAVVGFINEPTLGVLLVQRQEVPVVLM